MLDHSNQDSGARSIGKVFCVIPVFNRIEKTLACIRCLKQQTYGNLVILVCDGGSTDGTNRVLAEQHPDAIVLTDGTERWWGGATRLGVDWALKESVSRADWIMLLNNDVLFEPDYVEKVMAHSSAHNAAICGVVAHSGNNDNVVDAGVMLDWRNYAFRGKYVLPTDGRTVSLDSDVLPGRGTIIPIDAVRAAGTIDDARFPHYLSDYEFTYRLKTRGNIRLGVAFDAVITTSPDGAPPPLEKNPFSEALSRFKDTRSIRSKRNMKSHLCMIREHAPTDIKAFLLVKQRFRWVLFVIRPPLDALANSIPQPLKYSLRIMVFMIMRPRIAIQKIGERLETVIK